MSDRSRLPPHSAHWERVLLSGLLREPELVAEACLRHGVEEADLYHHPHRLVFRAAWELVGYGTGGPYAVYVALKAAGGLADLGPRPARWLLGLLDADPTGAYCHEACGHLRLLALRRRAIRAATEVLRDAYAGGREPGFYERVLG